MNAYKELFNNKVDLTKNISQIDDGTHHLAGDKYFEWWYFDVSFFNGYHLVIAIHSPLFNMTSRPSVIAVHLYGPNQLKVVEVLTFNSKDIKRSKHKCKLEFGTTEIVDKGSFYSIQLFGKKIETTLIFHPQIPGIQIGTGTLYLNKKNDQSFHWNIPIPRANVEGLLKIDGAKLKVKGIGYHDHNWGNVDLQNVFRRWIWGRILTKDLTIIFADIIGRGFKDNRVKLYVMWKKNDLIFCTDQFKIDLFKSEYNYKNKMNSLDSFDLDVNHNNKKVFTNFTLDKLLDVIDFVQPRMRSKYVRQFTEIAYLLLERIPGLRGILKKIINLSRYIRFNAKCEISIINEEKLTANALCEIIDFGNDI